MPLGRKFGFMFRNHQSEEELLHTLAHELGHGLFTLRHTFSSSNRFYQPQTSTDNLMSYGPPTATRLYKYQWDAIQNPQTILFAWAEEEEEGKLIATKDKDSISVKIEKFNADFAPGFGKLEIQYLLGEKTMNIIKKCTNEKFNFYITIANGEGKIIYNKQEKPKEKGEFTWDGINHEKNDTIKIDNGPYNIALTLIGGEEKGWFEDWKTFKDKLYTAFHNDSVFQIAKSIDTTFNVNPVRLEWIRNKDMQKYVNNSYEYYVKLRDLYMEYDGIKKAGNPFEYLKNNTKEIEFLGNKIRVHNEFAIVLQKIEETLKAEGVYNELREKYKNDKTLYGLSMREINDPNGGISLVNMHLV